MSLEDIARAVAARKLPPVEQWRPAETVDSHMRILADGRWLHEGEAIRRPAMVRAFASLLAVGEDGRHALVTPQCRQLVEVEDAAFLAVDLAVREEAGGIALAFRLNTDELVVAGPEHPLRVAGDGVHPAIYLAVGRGCEARLDRSTWLQLAEHALESADEGGADAAVWVESRGARFALSAP